MIHPTPEVLLREAHAALARGDAHECARLAHEALPGAMTAAQRAEALVALGDAHLAVGALREARGAYAEVVAAQPRDAALLVRALTALGRAERDLGDPAAAAHLRLAADAAERAGDAAAQVAALNLLGNVQYREGDLAGALGSYGAALDLCRARGDALATAKTLTNLGLLYDGAGDSSEALKHLHEALLILPPSGAEGVEIACRTNVGRAYEQLGRFEEARAHFARALALAEPGGNLAHLAILQVNLGETWRQTGHFAEARVALELGLDLARRGGHVVAEAAALSGLGLVLLAQGDAKAALATLAKARAASAAGGDPEGEAGALVAEARALVALGRPEAAGSVLADAERVARGAGRARLVLAARALLAETCAALGRHEQAYAHLRAAVELERELLDEDKARAIGNLSLHHAHDLLRRETQHLREVQAATQRAREAAERKVAEQLRELERRALNDALTGLPNRALFRDRLARAIGRAAASGGAVAIGVLDLNNFRVINDTLGHDAGDALLCEVAARLAHAFSGATVARMGGDEFMLLVDDLPVLGGVEGASALAHRALSDVIAVRGHEVFVTASLGWALYPDHGEDGEELLRRADHAVHLSKGSGTPYEVFGDETGVTSTALELGSALHRALDRGEFEVHYQPLVDAHTHRVVAAEALLRWVHPQRGRVSPADFIPLAEKSGLIVPIGAWVLREAATRAARWDGVRVAVNLSARQFAHPGLVRAVHDALDASGLAPARLEVEITESLTMRSTRATEAIFEELRALGVRVALDDFGTGHSSLAYLKRFQPDVLKIDRAFVSGLHEHTDATLVKAIVDMGHALGAEVVAEGIETTVQRDILTDLGVDVLQGYLFAKPAPDFDGRLS